MDTCAFVHQKSMSVTLRTFQLHIKLNTQVKEQLRSPEVLCLETQGSEFESRLSNNFFLSFFLENSRCKKINEEIRCNYLNLKKKIQNWHQIFPIDISWVRDNTAALRPVLERVWLAKVRRLLTREKRVAGSSPPVAL